MLSIRWFGYWLCAVAILLLVPEESRVVIYDMVPADWYGELRIELSNQDLLIAKNSHARGSVSLGEGEPERVVTVQDGEKRGFVHPDPLIPPRSVNVVFLEGKAGRTGERRVTLDSSFHFAPRPLLLLTRSDLYWAYILMAAAAGGFLFVGHLLTLYSAPGTTELVDTDYVD